MAASLRAYKINRKDVADWEFERYKAGFDIDERFFEEGELASPPGVETHYHAAEKKTGRKFVYIVRAQGDNVTYEFRPEYKYQKYGEPFPTGDYVFDDGLTISVEPGGHKRPRVGGPYRSWVDVSVEYNGVSGKFPLYRDQDTDNAPVEYSEKEWEGFLIKRLGEDEFVVTPQKT